MYIESEGLMAKIKALQLHVEGTEIDVITVGDEDYLSLTKMVKGHGGNAQIQNWMRSKDTISFLGLWEAIHNPSFNSIEFDRIRFAAGVQTFILSVKEWTTSTSAIGIAARAGKYGGTYAHKDIAFEFATWLSPVFKLLLITEFQKLKEEQSQQQDQIENWDFKRFLSKANYKLHSSTIKETLIPTLNISKDREWLVYASEADVLNKLVFGQTAAEWRTQNKGKFTTSKNQRDYASAKKLLILANLEAINSNLISRHMNREQRVPILYREAQRQAEAISEQALEKSINDSGIGLISDSSQLSLGE